MTVSELATSENLASLGFSAELAAVITPDEFCEETERAWKTVLQELKGETPPTNGNGNSVSPRIFARPAEGEPSPGSDAARDAVTPSPSPIPMGEGRGEGRLSDSARAAAPDELDTQSAADDERFPFYSAAQLNSGQFETRYLIPGVLAAAQPGGIFGAFKTLKTSITADLLISLASGTPFLGHFPVAEPGRTLFLSGESGLAALQSIARRICSARGLSLETLDNFELSPKLPHLDNADDLRALGRIVRKKRPVCVAIDPAYLAIRGEDARNLFAMGSLLRPLAELCDDTGCTILIVHHCKRTRITPGDPATLDDIAWSGFAEFSAQWFLLSRRRRFDPDTGHHELWFSAGGRAGHHALCALDVDEGRPTDAALVPSPGPPGEGGPATSSVESGEGRNSPSPIPMGEGRGEGRLSSSFGPKGTGRTWNTAIRRVASAEVQSDVRQIKASEDRRVRRAAVVLERDRDRTIKAVMDAPGPVSANYLRDALGLNGLRINRVLASLLNDGILSRSPQMSGNRTDMAYWVSAKFKNWLEADDTCAAEPETRMNGK